MNNRHAELIRAMVDYDRGDPMRIHHFLKVHDLAAAILHDIGIHVSEEKYGSSNGKYQEKEGPAEAEKLLRGLGGYTEEQIGRVKYLVAHHHTYGNMDGLDYQILVEADFLVNLYEDNESPETVANVRRKIFKTATGTRLLDDLYAPERKQVLA